MRQGLLVGIVCLSLCAMAQVMGSKEAKPAKTEKTAAVTATLLQQEWDAWCTLDAKNAAKYYDTAAPNVYFDIEPQQYHGWAEYQKGAQQFLDTLKSADCRVDQVKIHTAGAAYWTTAIVSLEDGTEARRPHEHGRALDVHLGEARRRVEDRARARQRAPPRAREEIGEPGRGRNVTDGSEARLTPALLEKTMRIRVLAVLAVLLITLPTAFAGLPPMTPEKWREDLRYFAAEAPKNHKNLFHTMTREQFESAVRQLDSRLPGLNDDQAVAELARIVAMIRDGHTYIPFGREPLDYPRLPVRFEILDDGVVVRAAAPTYADLVGGKVVSIGGKSMDAVLASVSDLAPRDNDMTIRSRTPLLLTIPAVLHGLGLAASTAAVPVVVEKNGRRVARDVAAEPLPPESRHVWVPDPSWVQAAGDQRPLWLRHPDDNYWYEYLPDSRTLYVHWNTIQNKKDETVAHFFQRVFEFAGTKPVERLVLDLRLNGGGNNYLNTEPIKEILRSPLNRRGKFFVLIGPRTFSAAQNLTNILHKYSEAVWVGEPTGASPNSFGDPAPLTLPNSKIQIYLSTLWWQDLDERDKRPWQAPDVAIEPTVKDFAAGRDPVMEAVLRWQDRPSLVEVARDAARRKDYAALRTAFAAFRKDPANKYASFESDFNNLGYELLNTGDTAGAIEVFKVNVEAYPDSWNVYDSLGEAYMKAGEKAPAIEFYEKSLKLNPRNRGGEAALEQLRAAK